MEMNSIEEIKIKRDSFDYETFKDDLVDFVKSLNYDESKSSLDDNYRLDFKKEVLEYLNNYFIDLKNNFVFDFNDHTKFHNKSLAEAKEEYPFKSNHIDKLFEKGLRAIAFRIPLNLNKEIEETELRKSLDESYENIHDSLYTADLDCSKCDCFIDYTIDFKNLKVTYVNFVEELKPCSIKMEKDFTIELDIPSKKIVFTNYFRGLLDDERYDNFDLNNYKGMLEHTRAYEKDNIGYISVGNSAPQIYLNKEKNKIIAGRYSFLEDYGYYQRENKLEDFYENFDVTKEEVELVFKTLKGFEYKNYISTDLWAVTFMDYDQFVGYLNKKGISEQDYEEDFFIVDINSTKIKVKTNNIEYKKDKKIAFEIKAI